MSERMYLQVDSSSSNISFVRAVIAAFCARLDPTLEELEDVKTAVSEAVTNAVIHGYREQEGIVEITCRVEERRAVITIEDHGAGIADIVQAMEPLYTGRPDLARSGMGFSFMEAFTDKVSVESQVGCGTKVTLEKEFQQIR